MGRMWRYLFLLLSLLEGFSALNSDCPNCELCPLTSPGCCFLFNGTMIENDEIAYGDGDSDCVTSTCIDGELVKESACPTGFVNIGLGCYFIGDETMMWKDAMNYCQHLGPSTGLANLQDKQRAKALEGEIDEHLPSSGAKQGLGTLWLGVDYTYDFFWLSTNTRITEGFTNFVNSRDWDPSWQRISAYSVKNGNTDYGWYYESKSSRLHPLCEATRCIKELTCSYEGREYRIGEIIWRDSQCKCSWIECGSNGQIKAIDKKKPCCEYNGEVYGDGDTVRVDKCYKLVCKYGSLMSHPDCNDYTYFQRDNRHSHASFHTVKYGETFSCYHYTHTQYTFQEASQYCAKQDSKLAEITSPEEQYAVEEYLHQHGVLPSGYSAYLNTIWIGGKADTCDGRLQPIHWTSADTQYLPVESIYEEFCEGYPKNETEDQCLYMGRTPRNTDRRLHAACWKNGRCNEKKRVLCEKCAECEHKHMTGICVESSGKISRNGTIINFYNNNNICVEEICINGRIIKKEFICQSSLQQQAARNEEEQQS